MASRFCIRAPSWLQGVNWLIQMHDEKVNCILGSARPLPALSHPGSGGVSHTHMAQVSRMAHMARVKHTARQTAWRRPVLLLMWCWRFGALPCCAGDEMGLGKTVQNIAYLTHLKARPEAAGDPRPFLVLCPLTLVQTWAEVKPASLWSPQPIHPQTHFLRFTVSVSV